MKRGVRIGQSTFTAYQSKHKTTKSIKNVSIIATINTGLRRDHNNMVSIIKKILRANDFDWNAGYIQICPATKGCVSVLRERCTSK